MRVQRRSVVAAAVVDQREATARRLLHRTREARRAQNRRSSSSSRRPSRVATCRGDASLFDIESRAQTNNKQTRYFAHTLKKIAHSDGVTSVFVSLARRACFKFTAVRRAFS